VRENRISGEVPSELGQLLFLGTLAMARTELTGRMPAAICELKADCEEIACNVALFAARMVVIVMQIRQTQLNFLLN
jgi:hypothetical protein